MIRYALACSDCETGFEAWFSSSGAYDEQAGAGMIECPACSGTRIGKQIMAPSVHSAKGSTAQIRPKPAELLEAARTYIAETHDYVGSEFPDEARAMHYGEVDERPIWGEATAEDSKAMHEEGIGALPLPASLAPVPPKDKSKLN